MPDASTRRPRPLRRGPAAPSAARRRPTRSCRSCATSPPAAASRTSGSRRSASTTTRFGGRSPINDQNRALLARAAGRARPARHRHPRCSGATATSTPFIADALREAHAAAPPRLVTVVTSAYSCYSSCRQYREDLADARRRSARRRRRSSSTRCGPTADHPGFGRANGAARSSRPCALAAPARRPRACSSSPTRSPTRWTTRPGPATARATSTAASTCAWRGRLTDEVNARPRPRPRRASWCSARAPARRPSPGSSPTSTTASRSWRAERVPAVVVRPDRLRLRPHGGRLRPRHRGRRDGRAARAAVRAGADRRHRRPVRRRAGRPARSSAPPRPAARQPSRDLAGPATCARRSAPPGCCPNLRAAKPGPVRERLMASAPALPHDRRRRPAELEQARLPRWPRERRRGWSSTSGRPTWASPRPSRPPPTW